MPAVISWSGGKDSCLALMRVRDARDVRVALTMLDETGARSRSHGLRPAVLTAQVERLGLESVTATASWADYTEQFVETLQSLAARGFDRLITGDIEGASHLEWTRDVAARAGMTAELPLWGEPTAALVREFLARGGDARIVTVRTPPLEADWLGRRLATIDIAALAARGGDAGGERGEYHSVVTHCPLFARPLALRAGARVAIRDCWALDLDLDPA
jgi:uncharacterized protein (TIGR00290 family)